jgi:hypothetical protein
MLICFGFLTSIAVFCDAIFSDLADATERRHFNTKFCVKNINILYLLEVKNKQFINRFNLLFL